MNLIAFIVPAVTGLALGGLFYGGLWLTVARLLTSRDPSGFAVTSFFVRTAIVIAGFIWATAGQWQNAVACLVGFELARLLILVGRRRCI